jgi:hypothetical protein
MGYEEEPTISEVKTEQCQQGNEIIVLSMYVRTVAVDILGEDIVSLFEQGDRITYQIIKKLSYATDDANERRILKRMVEKGRHLFKAGKGNSWH